MCVIVLLGMMASILMVSLAAADTQSQLSTTKLLIAAFDAQSRMIVQSEGCAARLDAVQSPANQLLLTQISPNSSLSSATSDSRVPRLIFKARNRQSDFPQVLHEAESPVGVQVILVNATTAISQFAFGTHGKYIHPIRSQAIIIDRNGTSPDYFAHITTSRNPQDGGEALLRVNGLTGQCIDATLRGNTQESEVGP